MKNTTDYFHRFDEDMEGLMMEGEGLGGPVRTESVSGHMNCVATLGYRNLTLSTEEAVLP